jgi:hypothetical protein
MLNLFALGLLVLVCTTSGAEQAVFLVGELLLLALARIDSSIRGLK